MNMEFKNVLIFTIHFGDIVEIVNSDNNINEVIILTGSI